MFSLMQGGRFIVQQIVWLPEIKTTDLFKYLELVGETVPNFLQFG